MERILDRCAFSAVTDVFFFTERMMIQFTAAATEGMERSASASVISADCWVVVTVENRAIA
jgi:hypothetical protein